MQDDLFQLIKSLTRSEKRYLKMVASTHRKNARHMVLYDAIEKQSAYDEEALLRLFRDRGFSEHISVAKKYLYRLIMKALRAYHGESSQNAVVKDMLRDVEILRTRGLYDQSGRMLEKAAAAASANDNHYHMMEVSHWRRDLLGAGNPDEISPELLEQEYAAIYHEERSIIAEMELLAMSRFAFDLLSALPPLSNAAEAEAIRKKMPEIIVTGEIPPTASHMTRAHLLYTRTIYLSVMGDHVEHYRCCREFIAHVEERSWRDVRGMNYLITGLNELLGNLLLREMHEEAADVLERFRRGAYAEQLASQPTRQASVVLRYLEYSLELDNGRGNSAACVKRIPEIVADVERFGRHIADEQLFRLKFDMATAYFATGDYRNALRQIEPLINHGPRGADSHWWWSYSLILMLHLLIHYELGSNELLEYRLKSYYRFLARKNKPYRIEESLLRFLRRALRLADRRDLSKHLQTLAGELRELRSDPFERRMSAPFLLAWAESRIEGNGLDEVMRRNAEDSHRSFAPPATSSPPHEAR